MKIVLQKYIAESGFCSRRQAEEMIRRGQVFVNDEKAKLGARVDGNDKIEINKKRLLLSDKKVYIKLNKPAGYVSTNRKFANEKNVFDLVNSKTRLFIVGRLDKDSRGLILLTNDGFLAEKLSHPRHEHEKVYEVKLEKDILSRPEADRIINRMKGGIDIGDDDGIVRAKDVKYLGKGKFRVVLTQGKKRQIRRMFKYFDLSIEDLVRVSIAGLVIKGTKEGTWKYLTENEIEGLFQMIKGEED